DDAPAVQFLDLFGHPQAIYRAGHAHIQQEQINLVAVLLNIGDSLIAGYELMNLAAGANGSQRGLQNIAQRSGIFQVNDMQTHTNGSSMIMPRADFDSPLTLIIDPAGVTSSTWV